MSDQVVSKTSPRTVDETVARLIDLVTDRGLRLFAVIDHGGAARDTGLALRDTKVVVFGSPQAGTPVMDAHPLMALDLPLKVLVWAADDGTTTVSYTPPATLVARYSLAAELAARFAAIDAITDALVAA
ncbi:MAG TPA: DUF302 domain-containing protein [Conexibacter sp.]